jgi:hypothetical protein
MLSRSSEDGALRTLPLSYEDGHELDQNEKIPPQVKRGENRNERRRKCCPKGDIPQNKINATDKFNEASNRKQAQNTEKTATKIRLAMSLSRMAQYNASRSRISRRRTSDWCKPDTWCACLMRLNDCVEMGAVGSVPDRLAQQRRLWKCMILEDDRDITLTQTEWERALGPFRIFMLSDNCLITVR